MIVNRCLVWNVTDGVLGAGGGAVCAKQTKD